MNIQISGLPFSIISCLHSPALVHICSRPGGLRRRWTRLLAHSAPPTCPTASTWPRRKCFSAWARSRARKEQPLSKSPRSCWGLPPHRYTLCIQCRHPSFIFAHRPCVTVLQAVDVPVPQPPAPKPLRVLCLHGWRTSAAIMRIQLRHFPKQSLDMHFVDGAHESSGYAGACSTSFVQCAPGHLRRPWISSSARRTTSGGIDRARCDCGIHDAHSLQTGVRGYGHVHQQDHAIRAGARAV